MLHVAKRLDRQAVRVLSRMFLRVRWDNTRAKNAEDKRPDVGPIILFEPLQFNLATKWYR